MKQLLCNVNVLFCIGLHLRRNGCIAMAGLERGKESRLKSTIIKCTFSTVQGGFLDFFV